MFGGIAGMGQLAGLLGKLPKIQEEFGKMKERLPDMTAEGQAGNGLVTVRVNGKFNVLSCQLGDVSTATQTELEEWIATATNRAFDQVKQQLADEAQRVAQEIGLPPGLNLPGLL